MKLGILKLKPGIFMLGKVKFGKGGKEILGRLDIVMFGILALVNLGRVKLGRVNFGSGGS